MGTSMYLRILGICLLALGAAADGRSLGFVFDTTGSMGSELQQVIAGAQSILQAALNSTQRDWRDFILVPFSDPRIGPETITTDPATFKRILSSITVSGGDDCPEMSIGGILKALQVARPQSYLYVFTDATGKDYRLTDQVIATIQEKESKVIFVLTGDCNAKHTEGYKAYERIASASSGQVFEVGKGNVKDVLRAVVEVTIKDSGPPPSTGGPTGPGGGSKVTETNLVSLDKPTPTKKGGDNVVVSVDTKSSGFTVSLSGGDPAVNIINPQELAWASGPTGNGSCLFVSEFEGGGGWAWVNTMQIGKEANKSKITTVLKLPNVEIIKVKDPQAGNWTVNYVSNTRHTMRVTGSGTIGFEQRFPTSSIGVHFNTANTRPYADTPVYTMIRGVGLNDGDQLNKVEFIKSDGTVLQSLPLYPADYNPDIYFANSTVVPNGVFLLQVFGVDSKGFVFKRISKSGISAIPVPAIDECGQCTKDGSSRCVVIMTPLPLNPPKFMCECKAPFFSGDGTKCDNVNECELNMDNCDVNANCTDTWGRFRCDCIPGWGGNGAVCENIDECSLGTHACGPNANCTDTIGSYECICNPGYESDGQDCVNVDECALGPYTCDFNAYCSDNNGSYDCLCHQGYIGNGYNCTADPAVRKPDLTSNLIVKMIELKKELVVVETEHQRLLKLCNLQGSLLRRKRWLDDWSGGILSQKVANIGKRISELKSSNQQLEKDCTYQ